MRPTTCGAAAVVVADRRPHAHHRRRHPSSPSPAPRRGRWAIALAVAVSISLAGFLLIAAPSVVAQSSSLSTASTSSPSSSSSTSSASPPSTASTATATSSTLSSASPSPSTCPVCFNCQTQGCYNYGSCTASGCSCATGFGGPDCASVLCGSTNSDNTKRPVRATGTTCSCDSGFSGPNCNICEVSSACQVSNSGSQTPVCNKDVKVWKSNYGVCTVNTPLLAALYPKTTLITLARDQGAGTTLGSSKFLKDPLTATKKLSKPCYFSSTVWYDGVQQFTCSITGCTQQLVDGSYHWHCTSLQCQCIGSSAFCGGPGVAADLSGPIKSANGEFELTCASGNTTTCNANFQFLRSLFPNGLEIQNCDYGECALPSDNPDLATLQSSKELSAGEKVGVGLAAFVGALILAGDASFGLCLIRLERKKLPITEERRGVSLGFSISSYSIGKRKLLRDVQGTASPGKVLAIMGPSGAGKTTLLDILAGKSKSGVTDGYVSLDGSTVAPSVLRKLVGYVDQEDLLLPTLTVRETLMFSASLRLPDAIPQSKRIERVERILEDLGLAHVADSRIGGFGHRGISGGEKRRVSIGVELVTNPPVLLLDEPTSGLDSFNALSVIRTLADLARTQRKTILFTIHQPRSDVYSMFDDVLVLSGGSPVYFGAGAQAAPHFRSVGKPCPESYNIADHLLDLAVGESSSNRTLHAGQASPGGGGRRVRRRLWEWRSQRSPGTDTELMGAELDYISGSTSANDAEGLPLPPLKRGSVSYHASFLTQLVVLLERSFRHLYRSPTLLIGHIALSVVLGVFIGGVYYHTDATLGGVQNRLGAILFILSLLGFSGLSGIGSFSTERNLFLRERSNGFYSPTAYYVCRLIADTVPLRLVPAAIIGSISYYMIGFAPGPTHFGKFMAMLLLFSAEIGFFCLLFAILIADIGAATLCGAIVILFNMLFSGWLINQGKSSIVVYLRWIQYLSLFRYTFEALIVNDLSEIQVVDNVAGATINIPATVVLDKFGFDANAFVQDLLVSAGILVFLGLLNGALVRYFLKERR
ncbi:hypothetical protein DFJ73DRAFT_642637 [Zopfochytrium polystomum]|nr:hypothetical protein DFJ73DRAFT_642637 [Zopfochytrium polystomum]